jgi:DnaJ-class molecular chaperone
MLHEERSDYERDVEVTRQYLDELVEIRDPQCTNCGGSGEVETELFEGLATCWECDGKGTLPGYPD